MTKFNTKNNKSYFTRGGFTLLEALVAISVLMVAVAAPITIAQRGLNSARLTKNQLVASYLAQDALEYIKNKRDEVTINSVTEGYHDFDWNNLTIFNTCKVGNLANLPDPNQPGCQIDTTIDAVGVAVVGFDSDNHLLKNDNFFNYSPGGDDTGFTRQIQIVMNPNDTPDSGEDEALVVVTVRWGKGNNQIVVKSLIYNY